MSATNRMASFLATMKWEGGDRLSLDHRDPGNWTGGRVGQGELRGTRWGVAASAHPTLDIANLSAGDALRIFVEGYWSPIDGDGLEVGVDHCVSDDAFNSGPGAARRRYARAHTAGDALATIHAHSRARLGFLHALRNWRTFGRGWAARVAGVEAESVRMFSSQYAASDALSAKTSVKVAEASSLAAGGGGLALLAGTAPIMLAFNVATMPQAVATSSLLPSLLAIWPIAAGAWRFIAHTERARALASLAR
jgi:lysozyme family protein